MRIILIIIIFCFISCKEDYELNEKHIPSYDSITIDQSFTGHFFYDCNVPYANSLLFVYKAYFEQSQQKFLTYDSIYTDSSGFLEYNFKYKTLPVVGGYYEVHLVLPNFRIRLNNRIENIEINISDSIDLNLKFIPVNNLSSSDTLYWRIIAGKDSISSFRSGPIDQPFIESLTLVPDYTFFPLEPEITLKFSRNIHTFNTSPQILIINNSPCMDTIIVEL